MTFRNCSSTCQFRSSGDYHLSYFDNVALVESHKEIWKEYQTKILNLNKLGYNMYQGRLLSALVQLTKRSLGRVVWLVYCGAIWRRTWVRLCHLQCSCKPVIFTERAYFTFHKKTLNWQAKHCWRFQQTNSITDQYLVLAQSELKWSGVASVSNWETDVSIEVLEAENGKLIRALIYFVILTLQGFTNTSSHLEPIKHWCWRWVKRYVGNSQNRL